MEIANFAAMYRIPAATHSAGVNEWQRGGDPADWVEP